ncbi:MAG: hypothetical protein D6690_14785 [Nitrospirae bacterium]|nr:MAG: hypothetical protein D6690_14785 [Nitrospirota bacterium]
MATLEERVAYLEGKVEEHSRGFGEIREMLAHLDRRITALDQKVDLFREELSRRIDALDQKVDRFREELSSRIDALDQKVDRFREELSSRIDALDQKIDRHFVWIIGVQITTLLAIIAALLAK